ncbi:hypothetical protein E0493_03145 [Roseomonas sp. M0104]|uniref:Lipoprotein n=1 Tax=Teichococcus coralli TaxID=2545983 RepID=A0A845B783_9PROT|nr:hypothetical protein [Pseudoroseomonas coralli]MXP62348.1 hypothetical protein [Pseudoroseomonas coralli]
MRCSDRLRRLLPALLLLLAAACGDIRPYAGHPGGDAPRLVLPPAYRIAVPPPGQALLSNAGATAFADSLAEALRAAEVPAAAAESNPLDWPLAVRVERQGATVVPHYELRDADGASLGAATGKPVPLQGWGLEDPALFKEVASRDAPAIAALLGRVEASRKASDPKALAGEGPLRIRLAGVKGAPGDGNKSLNDRMGDFLTQLGYLPQDTAEGATYAVQGVVNAVPVAGNKQRIELQWIVSRRDGYELGRVVQLNEVPRGSLNGLWGDVAYVAAEQAANGIRDVLRNATAPAQPAAAQAEPGKAPPETLRAAR